MKTSYKFDINKWQSPEYDTFIYADDMWVPVNDILTEQSFFGMLYKFKFTVNDTPRETIWLADIHISDYVIHKKKEVSDNSDNNESLYYYIADHGTYLGPKIFGLFIGYNIKTSEGFTKKIEENDNFVSKETFDKYNKKYILYKDHLYYVESFRKGTPVAFIRCEISTLTVSQSNRDGYLLSFVNNPSSKFILLTNPFDRPQKLFHLQFFVHS